MEATTVTPSSEPMLETRKIPPAGREYGLDWLRVFAFSLLILYHSGMAFVSWDWHLKNPQQSHTLEFFMLLVNRWRLPLLFFISGAGVYFSLRRRSFQEFSRERLTRLLIPLLVGMFVIVPPQIYFERLSKGAQYTYAEFYPSVFQFKPYPAGSLSWHHLWFVAYILVYSLAGIPFFAFLRNRVGQRSVSAMVRACERWPLLLYLVNVPNILVSIILGPHWPQTNNLVADWANLTGAFLTFLWGFTIASNSGFLDLITRRRKEFMITGLAVAALFFTAYYSSFTNDWPKAGSRWFWTLVSSYYGMTWLFALIGYARAFITQPSRWLSYATQAVYPFYIFHQTITVAIVYCLIPWSIGVWPKLALVAFVTLSGSWILYEIVRRITILRPLFGLKAASS
jgi:surface polysaccharide O-acyltransferase-like enzyme